MKKGWSITSNWNVERSEWWNGRVGCLVGRIGVPACSLAATKPPAIDITPRCTGEDAYTPRLTTVHTNQVTSFIPALLALRLLITSAFSVECSALNVPPPRIPLRRTGQTFNAQFKKLILSLVSVAGLLVLSSYGADGVLHGYTNTPFIPSQPWRVHDDTRPYPPMVTPAPDVQAPAPSDAIVLFDGSTMQAWRDTETWVVQDGAMIAGKKDIRTKELFGDMQLHIEWMTPLPVPGAKVSDRGNSGVFLLDQYEVQIFDTFKTNTIYADGMAGAIYGQHPPLVNVSRAPGEWQTFDITLTAPRFSPTNTILGRVTVFHNGILVQKDTVLLGGTSHRSLPNVKPHPVPAPIRLQAHGSPVKFRNIWVRPIKR